jgi:hypothetical protein
MREICPTVRQKSQTYLPINALDGIPENKGAGWWQKIPALPGSPVGSICQLRRSIPVQSGWISKI